MQNQRVNIYTFPHKGLRYGLSQLLFTIGKADHNDASDIQHIQSQTYEIVHLMHLHQEAEDECVMQPLAQKAPEVVVECNQDHHSLHIALSKLEQKVQALSNADAPSALHLIYSDLAKFFADYLLHMEDEESTLNEAIWTHFSDPEILAWQDNIMSKLSLADQMLWFKYIVPALNSMERQILLGGVKANAPQEVYQQVIDALSEYLSDAEITALP